MSSGTAEKSPIVSTLVSAADALELQAGLVAAAESAGHVKVQLPSCTLSDDEKHIVFNGIFASELCFFQVFSSKNLQNGRPTLSMLVSAHPSKDFKGPGFLEGGLTPEARTIEAAHKLYGVGGALFETVTANNGDAFKKMLKKLAKDKGKKKLKPLAKDGKFKEELQNDMENGRKPGVSTSFAWSQAVTTRIKYDEHDNESDRLIQFKFASQELFEQCTTPKSDEKQQEHLAMFHPEGDLYKFQQENPDWEPTSKFRFHCADGGKGHWSDLFANSKYGSTKMLASVTEKPWRCYLSTEYQSERFVCTKYLQTLNCAAIVGNKRSADADSGANMSASEKMFLNDFYSSKRARVDTDGGGGSAAN